jgi:hypothetical protein
MTNKTETKETTPVSHMTPSRREVLGLFGGMALTIPATGYLGGFLSALASDASQEQADKLARRFAKYYRPVPLRLKPRIPSYALPLDLTKLANFAEAAPKLGLTKDEPSLKKNGFAVLPGRGNEDIVEPYKDLKQREVPIFITADTLLHLYHVQFDETLKDIEEREFYKDIVALAQALVNELEKMTFCARAYFPAQADFRAARHKALTYFAIGLKALKPEAKLPKGVDPKEVNVVLEKMRKHQGFWPEPPNAEQEWPLFRYAEDFSQYVPRGHYTRSEILKKYFVGMMWFGRMTFLIKGDKSHGASTRAVALVSVPESNQQTLAAAALITELLERTKLPDGRKARAVWERMYAVTSFYVGLADDLGLDEYRSALAKVCGSALHLNELADAKMLLAFKVELAKCNPPAIFSGTGMQSAPQDASPGALLQALNKSMGFRLMGQRFVPDSYMMGKLVWPTVGEPTRDGMFTYVTSDGGPIRGFPRGLDVMTILGSRRAREILKDLGDDAYSSRPNNLSYDQALTNLQKEYGKLSDLDWNRNLYWSWLHALKPLLAEYGEGYQSFMGTQAYRTKSLTSALASWAQLRHDTILYAKQSYTMGREASIRVPPLKPVQGYVEPLPEFYGRLLALARMTNQGLTEMKVLNARAKARLDEFEKLLERLLAVSEKELANEELKEQDYQFIRNFGEHLEGVVVAPDPDKLKALQQQLNRAIQAGDVKRRRDIEDMISLENGGAMKTTLIADVHTDQNSKKVLEEGTGYVDLGVFVYRQPDGRLVLGAGPVLSYHEFKHPMSDRLTDEKWRTLLKGKDAHSPLEWTREYLSGKAIYTCRVRS